MDLKQLVAEIAQLQADIDAKQTLTNGWRLLGDDSEHLFEADLRLSRAAGELLKARLAVMALAEERE